MSVLNIGESCLYTYDGTTAEYTGPLGVHMPAGVTRGARVVNVIPGSPDTYNIDVGTDQTVDGAVGDSLRVNGVEYSASLANGKISKANWAQVPQGGIATAIAGANTAAANAASDAAAAQSTANNAQSAATAAGNAASDLGQVKTQQGSSVSLTAGAAATVLLADGDRAVAAGKGVQADATISITSANLLASATVVVKLEKSTDGGSTWTTVVTKTFTLSGAVGNLIPASRDPAFSATCDRATAGNVRTRLTAASTGANVTVNECGLTTRWGVTPN